MCANRLIDKLSSVEQASQTRRVAGGSHYRSSNHTSSLVNSHNDDNSYKNNNSSSSSIVANREEALSEDAETLPLHIIMKTNFRKLNAQTPFFRCPEWADLPPVAFHLHCTRDGVALPSFNLHRYAFYLFGKNAAVCDYILQHPSVSNVHAALVFHREQECFVVVDLHSTNGVRVNRTWIPSQKPVPVTIGSIIQFGYSTRLYELRSGSAPSSSSERATSYFASDNNNNNVRNDNYYKEELHENKPTIAKRSRDNSVNDKEEQYYHHSPHRWERELKEELQVEHEEKQSTQSHNDSVSEHVNKTRNVTNNNKDNIVDDKHRETLTQQQRQSSSSSVLVHKSSDKIVEQNDLEDKTLVQEQINNINAIESVPMCSAHLYQLVIKHKDVDNPVSRGAHNKGEVITRSKEDARALAMHILHSHDKTVQGNEDITGKNAFVFWSVDEFVSAVLTYCEVSSAKKKGNLGIVTKGTFTQEFDRVAFALRRNEVGGPVETQIGIHLIYRSD